MNKTRTQRGSVFAGVVAAVCAALPVAGSASSITVDSVVQRWPWNNKVDITYTVTGGQNVAASVFARIVFTATIGGTSYTIDGVSDVGASASDGTHTVTWTAPSGLRATGCAMTAQLLSADVPSGDDYLVVDLSTGALAYEGLFATQEASNARYNADAYKTDKLVLRKVPAGSYYAVAKTWTTDKDYYAGVFLVTSYQYTKLCGGSGTDMKPKASIKWNDLRVAGTPPESPVPAVDSNTGTFFQRLNFLTGNKLGFDLPTEVMSEIAERAGATTTYFWGNAVDTDYIVCSDNSGGAKAIVGARKPNNWGLYDTAGNVWELCLDGMGEGGTSGSDPFSPRTYWSGWNAHRMRGGGSYGDASSNEAFQASYAGQQQGANDAAPWTGFRVFRIVK